MTIDERIHRIEHFTAGLDEAYRRQREEDRQLWRDTQRQLDDLSAQVKQFTAETDDKIMRTNETIARLAEESREADRRLGERIGALVSAMG